MVPIALTATVLLLSGAVALDDGLALTPPLGWRSYNAFGGHIDQSTMVAMMKAMVDRSRSVEGKPTSLLDLGYNRIGLDGGWNYCFPENHTFHWKSDGRPVWNDGFPDAKAMVAEAHALGLSPGWYLNNCGCAENQFSAEEADKVMRGSVRMLAEQGWDGVKFDSCSQMHNLTRWAELLNATGRPVLIENCHQGAYTPGMRQWQGYLKTNAIGGGSGAYKHFLGMFFGMAAATQLHNVSFAACRARCDALGHEGCGGFTFASDQAAPASTAILRTCYVQANPHPNHMDMSNANRCRGDASPSDCPFHMYRVSGDISPSWRSVLANLAYTRPFLGEGGLHPPYPPADGVDRSRPGGWAYPDMLEVGNLANATEDRTHFALWAIVSSPLILSFNLSDPRRMDRAWPIISNTRVLAVNQRWAGHPGQRVAAADTLGVEKSGASASVVGLAWQIWAKPLGQKSHAVLFASTGSSPSTDLTVAYDAISADFGGDVFVCLYDLYDPTVAYPPIDPNVSGDLVVAALGAHDSAFYCVSAVETKHQTCQSVAAQGGCPVA